MPETIPLIGERYAVMEQGLDLAGPVVASSGRLVLRKLSQPPRLAQTVTGVFPDGWMESDADIKGFVVPQDRVLRFVLSRAALGRGKPAAEATVTSGRFRRVYTLTPARIASVAVPVPSAPYRVHIHVDPTYNAAVLGGGDTRHLGAAVLRVR
jgi:hypothetical protein